MKVDVLRSDPFVSVDRSQEKRREGLTIDEKKTCVQDEKEGRRRDRG